MVFNRTHSTQVLLVINIMTGSISPQYHALFCHIFSTVVSVIAVDPGFWIRLFISRNSNIKFMLDQEGDSDLYE